jgi:hypothetical protein
VATTGGAEVAYWFNVDTRQVVTDETKGPGDNLMGPYTSEADAALALETARERTERWDEEDRAWEDEGLED